VIHIIYKAKFPTQQLSLFPFAVARITLNCSWTLKTFLLFVPVPILSLHQSLFIAGVEKYLKSKKKRTTIMTNTSPVVYADLHVRIAVGHVLTRLEEVSIRDLQNTSFLLQKNNTTSKFMQHL
jgi:hypothetical protein